MQQFTEQSQFWKYFHVGSLGKTIKEKQRIARMFMRRVGHGLITEDKLNLVCNTLQVLVQDPDEAAPPKPLSMEDFIRNFPRYLGYAEQRKCSRVLEEIRDWQEAFEPRDPELTKLELEYAAKEKKTSTWVRPEEFLDRGTQAKWAHAALYRLASIEVPLQHRENVIRQLAARPPAASLIEHFNCDLYAHLGTTPAALENAASTIRSSLHELVLEASRTPSLARQQQLQEDLHAIVRTALSAAVSQALTPNPELLPPSTQPESSPASQIQDPPRPIGPPPGVLAYLKSQEASEAAAKNESAPQ
jgi:hypothetical protein